MTKTRKSRIGEIKIRTSAPFRRRGKIKVQKFRTNARFRKAKRYDMNTRASISG